MGIVAYSFLRAGFTILFDMLINKGFDKNDAFVLSFDFNWTINRYVGNGGDIFNSSFNTNS